MRFLLLIGNFDVVLTQQDQRSFVVFALWCEVYHPGSDGAEHPGGELGLKEEKVKGLVCSEVPWLAIYDYPTCLRAFSSSS